jgi:hypothetical protein
VSTDEWNTPRWLAESLGHFDLDPCSNATSHISSTCQHTAKTNGLEWEWTGSVFLNFPYSKPLPWCERVRDHAGPWVVLAKLDPTTKWWAVLMDAMPTVAPFRKRLKFEGDKSMTANFPSVLVYSAWRPPAALVPHLWLQTWAVAA